MVFKYLEGVLGKELAVFFGHMKVVIAIRA